MIGYFGNAEASDSLAIEMKIRAKNVASSEAGPQIDFGFDYRVTRESDNKLIVVSSARKVSPIREEAEEEWVSQLR
jgi:hypothetical protein